MTSCSQGKPDIVVTNDVGEKFIIKQSTIQELDSIVVREDIEADLAIISEWREAQIKYDDEYSDGILSPGQRTIRAKVKSLKLILERKDYHRKFTYKPILEDLNGVFSVGDRESVECVDFSSSDMQTIMKYNFFPDMTFASLLPDWGGSDGAYLNPIRKYWLKNDKISKNGKTVKDLIEELICSTMTNFRKY